MKILEVKNLSFSYGDKKVLDNISFNIDYGEKVIIIGPNGCGKTTLLRIISGYLKADAGEILLEGKNLDEYKAKEKAKILAMMHQESKSSFDFKVQEVVEMGRYPYMPWDAKLSKDDKVIVDRSIKLMNLDELREKSILKISGGEKARVMAAKTFAQEPRLMLMDEPVSAMDIKQEFHLMNIVKKSNISYAIVLHDLNLAGAFADKIVLMKKGQIISVGTAKEVLTEENIKKVYEVDSEIIIRNDRPYVLPLNSDY